MAGIAMSHAYRRETSLEERRAHRLKPAVRKQIALLGQRETETLGRPCCALCDRYLAIRADSVGMRPLASRQTSPNTSDVTGVGGG